MVPAAARDPRPPRGVGGRARPDARRDRPRRAARQHLLRCVRRPLREPPDVRHDLGDAVGAAAPGGPRRPPARAVPGADLDRRLRRPHRRGDEQPGDRRPAGAHPADHVAVPRHVVGRRGHRRVDQRPHRGGRHLADRPTPGDVGGAGRGDPGDPGVADPHQRPAASDHHRDRGALRRRRRGRVVDRARGAGDVRPLQAGLPAARPRRDRGGADRGAAQRLGDAHVDRPLPPGRWTGRARLRGDRRRHGGRPLRRRPGDASVRPGGHPARRSAPRRDRGGDRHDGAGGVADVGSSACSPPASGSRCCSPSCSPPPRR